MKLQDLQHLRDDKRIRFSEEIVNGETLTIACYMLASPDLWKLELATECRGIVFNAAGDCVARPFNKFFNIGENEDTQVHLLHGKEFEILEKRDGSLLTPVMVGGETFWKTKKSFYSDVAVEAAKNVPDNVVELAKHCCENNITACFEYTSPFNRIVISYGDTPEFVLLAMRDNVTGKYLSHELMSEQPYGVKVIEKFDKTLEQCLSEVDTLTNFEGWCLRDVKTGFYCKLKTSHYLRLHRANTELRERDVADMAIDETIDDIKSALALDNIDMTDILKIEQQVVSEITALRGTVDEIVASIEDKTNFKEIAMKFKTHPMFGLIMSTVRGGEADFKKFWVNNYRENYSLKCVYNKNF